MSASRYAMMGGFQKTSNVAAGMTFGVPISGTHAHAFVMSFNSLADLTALRTVRSADGQHEVDFPGLYRAHSTRGIRELHFPALSELVTQRRRQLGLFDTNEGELAAFTAYAMAFPRGFLALVDTYDTLRSGIPNFVVVASVLIDLGYNPVGPLACHRQARNGERRIGSSFFFPFFPLPSFFGRIPFTFRMRFSFVL